jgi:hypothetical protein
MKEQEEYRIPEDPTDTETEDLDDKETDDLGGEDSEFMETDLTSLFQTFFLEDKKERNVVDVLLEVRRSIDTNNKIMLKMLGLLETYVNK